MMLLLDKSIPAVRKLRAEGYDVGELKNPVGGTRKVHDLPWAADNSGFTGVDIPAWLRMLGTIAGHPNCLFVVAPDVLEDSPATLAMYARYAPVIRDCGLPVAFVLQDGQLEGDIPWDADALFIGGSTDFKLGMDVQRMVLEAKSRGKWVHMGRVNSLRRMRYAESIGCDSADGTVLKHDPSRPVASWGPRVANEPSLWGAHR